MTILDLIKRPLPKLKLIKNATSLLKKPKIKKRNCSVPDIDVPTVKAKKQKRHKSVIESNEMVDPHSEISKNIKNSRNVSTFITGTNMLSDNSILPNITESKNKKLGVVPQFVTEVAQEIVEQYKSINNGSPNIEGSNIELILNTILQNNRYLQNKIQSVKLAHKKDSIKILNSKHNLYRFKSLT